MVRKFLYWYIYMYTHLAGSLLGTKEYFCACLIHLPYNFTCPKDVILEGHLAKKLSVIVSNSLYV